MWRARAAVFLALSACAAPGDSESEAGTDTGSTESESESDSESESGTESTTDDDGEIPPANCEGVGASDLDGVCIWFADPGGSWTLSQVAAGIEVPYHVIVEAGVDGVIPLPQDDGGCGQADASGLIVFAQVVGAGQQWCLCDIGVCPAPSDIPVTIPAGDSESAFEWTGVNWSGPSDTGNPFGPAFPAGTYSLEISAVGTHDRVPFTVSNSFVITLTDDP